MVGDICGDLVSMLGTYWAPLNTTSHFTPTFSTDWFQESWNTKRVITVRELYQINTMGDLCNATQELNWLIQFDCFADERDDAIDMRTELDRIIDAMNANPTNDITFMVQQRWVDNSFLEREMYRYTLEVYAIGYRSG